MTINHQKSNYEIKKLVGCHQLIINIPDTCNFLEQELKIQEFLNEAGAGLTGVHLQRFDTNGKTIEVGNETFYLKGCFPEEYKTAFGPVTVRRNVYQNSDGGKTFVPMERETGLVQNSSPLLARQAISKAVEMSFKGAVRDLAENHGNNISAEYIKSLSHAVGEYALTKEESWHYKLPPEAEQDKVKIISVGLDGTTIFLKNGGGWRETMCGTISLFDEEGERLHTITLGHSPEYGKQTFLDKLDKELNEIKNKFPLACVQGLADGAVTNWIWLNERTDYHVLDFYHLSEHVGKAAEAIFGNKLTEKETWLKEWLHTIKHTNRGVYRLIEYLEEIKIKLKGKNLELLKKEITYLENQKERTKYKRELENNRPIGSGVTESTCKNLVKARMCRPGMRWTKEGAAAILALRALFLTAQRWEQFWEKLMRYPIPR
jgi:hypothetical protein